MAASSNKKWVDGPYALLKTPSSYRDIKAHFAIYMADEMAVVHNLFIRGFNAIILQAPGVPSKGQPGYKPQDVKDFLLFTEILIKGLQHHHLAEEEVAFPGIERAIGKPGYLSVATEQHAAFHDGMDALAEYAKNCQEKPDEWAAEEMQRLLDVFMPALQQHLTEEVDLFLTLDKYDEEGLKKVWKEVVDEGKNVGLAGFYDLFPIFFSCHDRTYANAVNFPPVPGILRYIVYYYFARRHRGAWRFSPCDMWSNPRPLQFLKKLDLDEKVPAQGDQIPRATRTGSWREDERLDFQSTNA